MKKFALALMAASALVFGFGPVAHAQYGSDTVIPSDSTPTPGELITLTVTGCAPGEIITFSINGNVVATTTCVTVAALSAGDDVELRAALVVQTRAVATFAAPATPGTYTVLVTGNQGFFASIVIVVSAPAATTPPVTGGTVAAAVPGGGLPATGASGTGSMTSMAIGLLVVGLGLFVVAQVRRRQPSPA